MDIKWYGKTAFSIKEKKTTIMINPEKDHEKADIIFFSKPKELKIEEGQSLIDWPGEYEMKGVPIKGFQAWTKSKSKEEVEGETGEETIIFYFNLGGIKFCHLGELGHALTSDMINEIGETDILMIDLGENSNLSAKRATEIIEAIEPRCIIAMGEGDMSKTLKEVGADNVQEVEEYSVSSISDMPEDKRIFIMPKMSS
jgi:L-ascorbate metabolism protein UlaG (beta-lactamase superfamily)